MRGGYLGERALRGACLCLQGSRSRKEPRAVGGAVGGSTVHGGRAFEVIRTLALGSHDSVLSKRRPQSEWCLKFYCGLASVAQW